MRILLDTNAYSNWIRGSETISELVAKATHLIISPVVLGELEGGFRLGSRFDHNVEILDELLAEPFVQIAAIGRGTASLYAQHRAALSRKGQMIPSNDIWIAAQAIETEAKLISSDRHFERVAGLDWLLPDL